MAKKKDTEAASETAAPAEKVTQRVAVQRAITAGKDSPGDGVAYVKEQFGITLNNGAFSTIKSQLKKASGGSKPAAKRGRPAAVKVTMTAKPSTNGSPADLARQIKTLIGAYGVVAVSDMVSVFAD